MRHWIFSNRLGAALVFTLAYGLIYSLNNALTGFLYLMPGAHLVHIPSGVKLLLVLVGGPAAALGIALVSVASSLFFMFPGEVALSLVLATVNGAAPLWARKLLANRSAGTADLSRLTVVKFLQLGLLFACLNTSLNQGVLYWGGMTDNFAGGLAVMFIGDLTGCYIVMLLVKAAGRLLNQPTPNEENPHSRRTSDKNMS